ncbi:unnamed protein product [Rotaria sp. Silwood1]|nr:unnamed protein product [Rotaria sp. Silwood1]
MQSMKGLSEFGNMKKNINSTNIQKLTSQMSKLVDSRMLNHMGGASGLSSMIRQYQQGSRRDRLLSDDE